jgi:hypothetical protein
MHDEYIWGLVAFLNELPGMTANRYRELVDASGGHQHGGSESGVGKKDTAPEDDHSKAPPHQH